MATEMEVFYERTQLMQGKHPEIAAAFELQAAPYQERRRLELPLRPLPSRLRLMERLGMKLALNTISTGTMARLGRLSGNWMSHVDVSNKKLLDRGTRLIAELANVAYADACAELFRSVEELKAVPPGAERPSPVQHALRHIQECCSN